MNDFENAFYEEQEALPDVNVLYREDFPVFLQDEEEDVWEADDGEIPAMVSPKLSWQEAKEKLNALGNWFSQGDIDQRSKAMEGIFEIFQKVTITFHGDGSNGHKISHQYHRYAVAAMRRNFRGETDIPIQYRGSFYPEEMFHNAILHTLGYPDSQYAYNRAKGASYVTYFTNVLHFFGKRRRRALNKEYTKGVLLQQVAAGDCCKTGTTEEEVLKADEQRREAQRLVSLAALTLDKLQLDKMLSIGDDAISMPQKIKATTLQMVYSFHLVNATRFMETPVSEKDNGILIGAADKKFLTFSTALKMLSFQGLVQAELSDYIMENNLYEIKENQKILLQCAVEHYLGKSKSTVSEHFTNVTRYLRLHWQL